MAERNKSRACRNLLNELNALDDENSNRNGNGNVNGEATEEEPQTDFVDKVNQAMDEHMRAASQRWNFDFVEGVPLEGPWEWIPVTPEAQNQEINGQEAVPLQDQNQEAS